MYTQCPECSTAFRVTADVLKQAAGKVRCGGCGNAFNALEYLSESMPERQPAKPAEEDLPELKPEPRTRLCHRVGAGLKGHEAQLAPGRIVVELLYGLKYE